MPSARAWPTTNRSTLCARDDPLLPGRGPLANVPTWLCRKPDDLRYVLDHLHELVVKEVHGAGGYGMLIGPAATRAEIENFRQALVADPARYIAQPTLSLSSCPTFVEAAWRRATSTCGPLCCRARRCRWWPGADPGGAQGRLARRQFIARRRHQDTWVLQEEEGSTPCWRTPVLDAGNGRKRREHKKPCAARAGKLCHACRPPVSGCRDTPNGQKDRRRRAFTKTLPTRAARGGSARGGRMLSRTADHLFWMSRYTERAENTARMLNVGLRDRTAAAVHRPRPGGLAGMLSISELIPAYTARHGAVTREGVLDFMVRDGNNSSSILSCLRAARENARAPCAVRSPPRFGKRRTRPGWNCTACWPAVHSSAIPASSLSG